MSRIVRAVLFGVAGAIGLAVVSVACGFALAFVLEKTGGAGASSGLGILVPLFVVPVSALVGLVGGGIYGYRR